MELVWKAIQVRSQSADPRLCARPVQHIVPLENAKVTFVRTVSET
jgi:hypothetical protein